MPHSIRLATEDDAAAVAAIYAPVVLETPVSFELVPPDAAEIRSRMREILKVGPYLVREDDGEVVGYAYAGAFRARPAYRFTVETSVYIRADARGRGVGRSLYGVLLPCLVEQGYRRAIAGVTLPNAASVGLHEAMGFRPVGVFRNVGFKFGTWHDVGFWEREIAPHVAAPPEPRPVAAILDFLRRRSAEELREA
jgi:L-amino acid N-acyltransferase YncA